MQLREAVDQARDRFKLDSANYHRQKALWAQQIGSKNELEQRELAFNTSKAALTRAEKALVERQSARASDAMNFMVFPSGEFSAIYYNQLPFSLLGPEVIPAPG